MDTDTKRIREKAADLSELLRTALADDRDLTEPEAYRILTRYGISVPPFGVAQDADEAASIAGFLGYPVALKIVSPDILHKTDVGGVRVGLTVESEVRCAYEGIVSSVRNRRPDARVEGVLVSRLVGCDPNLGSSDAVEVVVGVTCDSQFGHSVMFGLGGIFVEILRDVTFRVTPVTHHDALDMISEIKGYKILQGIRGQSPRDIEAIAGIIVGVSRLVEEYPVISSVDLNPVIALPKGVCAVDAKITLRRKPH